MKTFSPSRVLRFAVLGIALAATDPARTEEAAAPAPWTEADSRLANHYIQLLQRDPAYGKVLDLLWDLYGKKGQTALLLDYFKGASESGPEVAKLLYAHLLRKGGDAEAARPLYDAVLASDPDNRPALKALAEIADQQRRFAKALSLYTRLAEIVPTGDEEGLAIRLRKAALHRLQGHTEAAVADWNTLLKSFPDNVSLRTEIVGLLLEAGETETAAAVLRELTKTDDPRRRLDALLELNRLHEFTDDFDGAVATAREAMATLHFRSPEYAGLLSRLVRLHERHDRLDELEEALAEAAAGENPAERALHDLAEFHRLTADPAKEEEAVARLVRSLPGDPAHRIRLADLQMRNDRYEAAAATLDGLIATGGAPLDLVLRRALVDLHAKGREAASARLVALLDTGTVDVEGRRSILDFARTHYLDGLVERLLVDPALASRESAEESSAALELARFLHERGRTTQAIDTLHGYAAAESAPLAKAARLHQVGVVFKDLGLEKEALDALDEAIALAPANLDYQSSRADLYVATKEIGKAIAALERIREGNAGLEARAETDQRIFSLIRGHYATKAETQDDSVLKEGKIRSIADYRRLAVAASQAASRGGDEPPPQELTDYYESIKRTANETPSTERRYRAAWWASKLQDNQECYEQLTKANEEAGKPVVEIVKMLLSLAEQNERTTHMVRHLTTLAEIDPERADDYRQRRAEVRFELGFEDEAMRELKALAAKPDASLATLATLAKLYQRQGSPGKQVEVWRRAYREADLYGKRGIVKQLSNALVESGQPEEALKVQIDLLERETDPVQRRKQFDGQLTVAQSHRLLDWMRERYAELAGRHPFDRFYPEALARVHRAAGDDREAHEAMKKAYYMSGRSEELLSELGALSGKLGDLKSAIYYRRQLLSRGEGDTLDNWKELVRMLEKDLRLGEADQLRRRLETKFGSDIDFLAELSGHYLKSGSPRDAERILSRLVELRGWDLDARFRLGLLQAKREEDEAAFATFSTILEETDGVEYPEGFGESRLPLVRAPGESKVEAFVFSVEAYPFIGGNLQEEIADALQQPHPEFEASPRDRHLVRLRSIEEAAVLAARLGRVPAWLAQWDDESRPLLERLWATRHAGAGKAFGELLDRWPGSASHIDQLRRAYGLLLSGDRQRLLDWTTEENDASGTQHPRSLYAALAALLLLKDNASDPILDTESVYAALAALDVPRTMAVHHFSELRKAGRFEEAYRVGEIFASGSLAGEPAFHYYLSQVAGLSGRPAECLLWLDRSLDPGHSQSGQRLMGYYYAALTEKLALLDSDSERTDWLRDLAARTDFSSLGGREAAERRLVFALAARDVGEVASSLRRIVGLESATALPSSDQAATGHERNQGWQRLDRLLHHCAERIRLDGERVVPFAEALGGEPPVDRSVAEVSAQYEQFEIDRALLLLEWMTAPERAAFLRELRGILREPDSRTDLAKSLESRGFHREAVSVYLDDAARRDRDYAPLQGLFDAAAEALDPEPALAVISQINTREFPAPPGLTVDYLNEQHARFLLMNRDLERLAQLGRQPEARDGAPPVASRAHLPYQDALVEGYRRSGQDEALLRLLADLRHRGAISGTQTLLGAETLARAGRHNEVLEWVSSLALASSEATLQRRAMQRSLESHAALGWKDTSALRELALASLERQPTAMTRRLARALHEAGASEEAVGVLGLLRRGTSDAVQRTAASAELLSIERGRGKAWGELSAELESYFLDFAYRVESTDPDPGGEDLPALVRPNAFRFVETLVGDPSAAEDLPAVLDAIAVPAENRWLANLLAAHFRGRLGAEARATLADLAPASPEAARLLETLPAFGADGIAAARAIVEESGRPGTAFFLNEPARQIAFFHRLGDRPRLVEVHGQLVREAGADAFHQSGLEDWAATLDTRRTLPPLLAAIGETELAGSLFRAYDRALASYQWNHLGFLNDYAAFLVGSGAYSEAEALLKRVLHKSLRIDLRLVPRLYAAWGRTGEWEDRLRDLHLTRGQEGLIRDWMTALAEDRELHETRDSW